MNYRIIYRFFILIVFVFLNQNTKAQLYAIGAEKAIPYPYKNSPVIAKLCVYNLNNSNWNKLGSLKAISPDSTSGWTFRWSVYVPSTRTLKDTLPVNPGADSATTLYNLKHGCYKVRMTKGSVDTSFYAWIILNKLRFNLVKTNDGFVKDFEYTCEYVDIRAIPKTDQRFDTSLRYYHSDSYDISNPETGTYNNFPNNVTFRVTGGDSINITSKKPTARIYSPPAENTKFTATYRDSLGNTATDVVTYKTINTKADFKIFIANDSMDNIPNSFKKRYKEVTEGEAVFWAKFINLSKNGVNFEWRLSDPILYPSDSSLYFFTTTDSADSVADVIYRYPHKYKVILISTSAKNCTDTALQDLTVSASKAGLEDPGKNVFPKVFTPGNTDGKDKNDYFSIKSDTLQSIRNLRLSIYNSRGRLMYYYSGKVADGWKGWDGKTKWGLDAPPGLYYYYFQAKGWGPFKKASTATGDNPDTGNPESESKEHDQHTTRRMTKGPHAITYTLYQDAAHTIIWGNGHGVGQLFRAPTPPLNTTITIPVYGQISPPQTGEAGIYLNQVQAVISWTPGPK